MRLENEIAFCRNASREHILWEFSVGKFSAGLKLCQGIDICC